MERGSYGTRHYDRSVFLPRRRSSRCLARDRWHAYVRLSVSQSHLRLCRHPSMEGFRKRSGAFAVLVAGTESKRCFLVFQNGPGSRSQTVLDRIWHLFHLRRAPGAAWDRRRKSAFHRNSRPYLQLLSLIFLPRLVGWHRASRSLT